MKVVSLNFDASNFYRCNEIAEFKIILCREKNVANSNSELMLMKDVSYVVNLITEYIGST